MQILNPFTQPGQWYKANLHAPKATTISWPSTCRGPSPYQASLPAPSRNNSLYQRSVR